MQSLLWPDGTLLPPLRWRLFGGWIKNVKPRFISCDDLLHQVVVLPKKCQILLTQCHSMSFLFICQDAGHELWTEFVHPEILLQQAMHTGPWDPCLLTQLGQRHAAILLQQLQHLLGMFESVPGSSGSRSIFGWGPHVTFLESVEPHTHLSFWQSCRPVNFHQWSPYVHDTFPSFLQEFDGCPLVLSSG